MTNRRPILLMPAPAPPGPRAKRPQGGGGGPHTPGRARQAQRLAPQFKTLTNAMDKHRLARVASGSGGNPEEVVVLVTVAPVSDFVDAVRKIAGLEWLGEIDEPDIPPDPDFFDPKNTNKPLFGRIYLAFANQQALKQILSLWHRWTAGQALGHGFAPFEQLFAHLKDVRPWGPKDRLEATGVLDEWRERVLIGQDAVRCEVELWFRRDPRQRTAASARMRTLLKELGGKGIQHVTIEEIAYDALLVELPITEIRRVLDAPDTSLVQCEDVRLFGAVGQMAMPVLPGEPEVDKPVAAHLGVLRDPVAALLDGLPLQNHQRLLGRLDVDDPDGWEADYPVAARIHGTAMASLILHGDLGAASPVLDRRLYVRPIMRGRALGWIPPDEAVPENTLVVDLVHRAVRRIVEGDGEEEPAAPGVCIVNFSIGDRSRPFDGVMSPLSRLLDYLAHRYDILFLVSAGNWTGAIDIAHTGPLLTISSPDLGSLALQAVAADARLRRLLSPAEGVNVFTVAAAHADASGSFHIPGWVDPYPHPGMPSLINGQGMGYRRCIKPDVLMNGGRVLVQEKFGMPPSGKLPLQLFHFATRPGQQVAAPGKRPGDTSAVSHTRGTSGATALATRAAIQLYDMIDALRADPGGALIDTVPMSTWIRTALMHAAAWPAADAVESALQTPDNARKYREYVTRLTGYGLIDSDRLGISTDHRVSTLGGGILSVDQSHIHRFPLPPSLSGKAGWRRLTITLSYFSPLNPVHQGWRRAQLWFEPPTKGGLKVSRTEADWQAVQRGTIQHEILEGDKADLFTDGDALEIRVSCRAVAGSLDEGVPYALAITLEVAEEIGVPIYDEIAQRIRAGIKIKPSRR